MKYENESIALRNVDSGIEESPLKDHAARVERTYPAHPPVRGGTRSGWPMRLVYLASDIISIGASLAITLFLGNWLWNASVATTPVEGKAFGLLAFGLLLVAAMLRSYGAIPPRPVRQFRGWLLGSFAVWSTLVAVLAIFQAGSVKLVVLLAVATSIAFLSAAFNRAICRSMFGKASWWGTRLIVVSSEGLARGTLLDLRREPQWGLRPIGFVADGLTQEQQDSDSRWLGPINALDQCALVANVDRALLAVHSFDQSELARLVTRAGSKIHHWIILPPLDGFPSLWLEVCEAARLPAITITNRLSLKGSLGLKRCSDLVLTLTVAMLTSPLIALLALLVKLSSKGPIFYGQERVGRGGRRFRAWKFRTMYPNADEVLADYLELHPELAAEWKANHKLKNDPRVTPIGRLLRSTSLDELPQLWNVIQGEMSLVGPRPIVSAEIEKYSETFQHYRQVRPGITGLWQVSGRNNTSYKERVDLDEYYVQNWSIWFDLYILACTVKVVLLGEGAY